MVPATILVIFAYFCARIFMRQSCCTRERQNLLKIFSGCVPHFSLRLTHCHSVSVIVNLYSAFM